jgi:hypothetical protein
VSTKARHTQRRHRIAFAIRIQVVTLKIAVRDALVPTSAVKCDIFTKHKSSYIVQPSLLLYFAKLIMFYLVQGSATFSLPWATLAIQISVEGRRKELTSWTVSETVFNLKSIGLASIHLKMDNNCVSIRPSLL